MLMIRSGAQVRYSMQVRGSRHQRSINGSTQVVPDAHDSNCRRNLLRRLFMLCFASDDSRRTIDAFLKETTHPNIRSVPSAYQPHLYDDETIT
jgi:hypothetical protein